MGGRPPRRRTAATLPLGTGTAAAPGEQDLGPDDPVTVGQYRLVRRLGSGGMGRVYEGCSPQGRPVAVKVVRAEYASDPEFERLFDREVRLARKVARFCTAQVLDFGRDRGRSFLVTELVDGPTLHDEVQRQGPLEAARVERVAVAVATALRAIHAAGTVHRDLKPSNVMLSSGGPLVIDFGIAVALESQRSGGVSGTPGYMSPEQARGERVGPAADIFAWGGVVAFASTGRAPFGEGPAHALLYRVVHEQPDLADVPEPLRSVVAAAMDRDPARRPTAAELYDRLLATIPAAGPATPMRSPQGPEQPGPVTLGTLPLGGAAAHGPGEVAQAAPGGPGRRRAGRRRRSSSRRGPLVLAGIGVIVATGAVALLARASLADDRRAGVSPPTTVSPLTPAPATTVAPTTAAATTAALVSSLPSLRTVTAVGTTARTPEEVWKGVLLDLLAARSKAWENGDESLLVNAFDPAGPAYATDLNALRDVVAAGYHTSAQATNVRVLAIEQSDDTQVVLRVENDALAFAVLDAAGRPATTMEPPPARGTVTLVRNRTGSGWRVWSSSGA